MMNNLNSILIEGNLVKDPELSYTVWVTAVFLFTERASPIMSRSPPLTR
jgi:single-stranded DNA-binding protein